MTARPPLEDRRLAIAAGIASFGSIAALLGHVWRIAPFWATGLGLGLPSLVALAAIGRAAARRGHRELALSLRLGAWGGVWGTLGYDLIRIPVHLAGLNPFAPIRSYGMYLANAPHATLATDLLGALYHFSNGITFGILYALVMRRRSLLWGVAWGLLLETLAVLTPFGAIYGVRHAPLVLFIAYFAHIYYGLPLGGALREPEHAEALLRRPAVRGATFAGAAIVLAFLALAWEPPGAPPPPRVVVLGPDAIRSGWTRVPAGEPVLLRSLAERPLRLTIKGLDPGIELAPGAEVPLVVPRAGLYQLIAEETGWRSAFLSVERGPYPVEP